MTTHNPNPETRWQQIRGSLVAMALTVVILPLIGLWAAASGMEKMWRKLKPKGR